MKIGVLNPFNFYWENPDIQTRVEAIRTENERLRQVHPFATHSFVLKDKYGIVIKELHINNFGYSITKELGKI